MTISYTLQPIPFWYFADLTGRPLAGGKLYSYSSINPTQSKPIYQDPAGVNEWPNPVIFDETGTVGPLYFKLDSTDPDDLYFLQIFDSSGNLVRQVDKYPISGGSGGGTVNTVQKIENIFVNSIFLDNIGSTTVQPIANSTFLAAGAHSGLYYPDIVFIQTGVSNAQDTLTFSQFGVSNPLSPDFASPYYINYTCLNNPTGETLKGVRIPISQYVNTLANQIFTMTIQARSNGGGANTLGVQLRQYFGTGGSPSADQVTNLTPTPITLTGSFVLYSISFSVPSIAGKTLSDSNDDSTYIEILFPVGQACNIDIAKPALYSGSLFPTSLYESVDEVEAEIEIPRTGDLKISMSSFSNSPVQAGWIPLNDGTIGNAASNSTTRAKADSWLLYNTIWANTVISSCPLYDSAGVITTKGGSSVSDWNANKQIQLPLQVGRSIGGRGADGYTPNSQAYTSTGNTFTVASTSGFRSGFPVVLSGGVAPTPLSNDTQYFVIVLTATTMQIALSAEAAIAGTPLTLTGVGNGTITNPPVYTDGQPVGESAHQDTISEMPRHSHPPLAPTTSFLGNVGGGGGGTGSNITSVSTTGFTGGSFPHNNISPLTFYNMIIKL